MATRYLADTKFYAVYFKGSYINFLTGQYEIAAQPALRHLTDQRSLAAVIRDDYPGEIREFLLTDFTP